MDPAAHGELPGNWRSSAAFPGKRFGKRQQNDTGHGQGEDDAFHPDGTRTLCVSWRMCLCPPVEIRRRGSGVHGRNAGATHRRDLNIGVGAVRAVGGVWPPIREQRHRQHVHGPCPAAGPVPCQNHQALHQTGFCQFARDIADAHFQEKWIVPLMANLDTHKFPRLYGIFAPVRTSRLRNGSGCTTPRSLPGNAVETRRRNRSTGIQG